MTQSSAQLDQLSLFSKKELPVTAKPPTARALFIEKTLKKEQETEHAPEPCNEFTILDRKINIPNPDYRLSDDAYQWLMDFTQEMRGFEKEYGDMYATAGENKRLAKIINEFRNQLHGVIYRSRYDNSPICDHTIRTLYIIHKQLPEFPWDPCGRRSDKHRNLIDGKKYSKYYARRWNYRFRQLVEYKHLNGHVNVNTKASKLGDWCRCQRVRMKNGTMYQDQYDALMHLGFEESPAIPGRKTTERLPVGANSKIPKNI